MKNYGATKPNSGNRRGGYFKPKTDRRGKHDNRTANPDKHGSDDFAVSQVTLGFVAGGGEYGNSEKILKNSYSKQFAGGTGGGATLTPVGFLVLSGSEVKMVKLCEQSNLEKIVDVTKDIVERFVKN